MFYVLVPFKVEISANIKFGGFGSFGQVLHFPNEMPLEISTLMVVKCFQAQCEM